ncbi:chromatin associated protein KTI12 [Geopyxis carbonaria]|nr:chromatin associated protein KTI12 [Geopyxis carbonaria]
MPLIMISGYPASGKTTRAHALQTYLEARIAASPHARERSLKVVLISAPLLTTRAAAYADARSEKTARAAEYSAIKRALSKDTLVIADGLNYIKGFRYQLFCEAKAVGTASCVVHVAAPQGVCREWNDGRAEGEDRYPQALLDNLCFRYEEPNGMARWDAPLFTVPYCDEAMDCDGIWAAMVGERKAVVKPNLATVLRPPVEGDYLQELDKVTKEVVAKMGEHQRAGDGGGTVAVEGCSVGLEIPQAMVPLPLLQRMRRQFIQLNRQHVASRERVKELFVQYLNENI